jgi:hypothetical protein
MSYQKNISNQSGIVIDNLQVNKSATFPNNVQFQNGIQALSSSTINNLTLTGTFIPPSGGGYIDTTTAQTITGQKTFTSTMLTNQISIQPGYNLNLSSTSTLTNNGTTNLHGTQTNIGIPTNTNNLQINSATSIGSVSFPNNLNVYGTTQFDGGININANITSNGLTITPTQLGYLSNMTSDIQSQITESANKITDLTWDGTYYYTNFNNNIHCYGTVQSDGSIQTPAINLSSSSGTVYTPGSTEIGFQIVGTKPTNQSLTLASNTLINFATITNLPLGTWHIQGVASAIATTAGSMSGLSQCSISITSATLTAGQSTAIYQTGAIAINNTVSLNYGFILKNTDVRNFYLVGSFTYTTAVLKNHNANTNFTATRIA